MRQSPPSGDLEGRENNGKGKQTTRKRTGNAVLRVLNKTDKNADRNLMKFNQSKRTVLHPRHNHPTQQARQTWESCCTAHGTGFSNMPSWQRRPTVPWAALINTPQGIHRIRHLCSAPKATCESSTELPSPKQMDTVGQVPWGVTDGDREVAHEMSQKLRAEFTLAERTGWVERKVAAGTGWEGTAMVSSYLVSSREDKARLIITQQEKGQWSQIARWEIQTPTLDSSALS